MITFNDIGSVSNIPTVTVYGLSTDGEKPTSTSSGLSIPNGSKFIEMDTKKVYMYDAENAQWLEW